MSSDEHHGFGYDPPPPSIDDEISGYVTGLDIERLREASEHGTPRATAVRLLEQAFYSLFHHRRVSADAISERELNGIVIAFHVVEERLLMDPSWVSPAASAGAHIGCEALRLMVSHWHDGDDTPLTADEKFLRVCAWQFYELLRQAKSALTQTSVESPPVAEPAAPAEAPPAIPVVEAEAPAVTAALTALCPAFVAEAEQVENRSDISVKRHSAPRIAENIACALNRFVDGEPHLTLLLEAVTGALRIHDKQKTISSDWLEHNGPLFGRAAGTYAHTFRVSDADHALGCLRTVLMRCAAGKRRASEAEAQAALQFVRAFKKQLATQIAASGEPAEKQPQTIGS